MKTGHYLIALLSCLCLLAVPRNAFAYPTVVVAEGLVVGVAGGDGITVNSQGSEIKIKLYGVAAPQTAKIDKFTGWYKAGQPYGDEAFRALSSKVLHQMVKVEIRSSVPATKDHPQLAIAVVYLDGRNINMEMLAEGWGWVNRRFMTRSDYAHYILIEKSARGRKIGLWLQDDPQPPWEFKPEPRVRVKQHG